MLCELQSFAESHHGSLWTLFRCFVIDQTVYEPLNTLNASQPQKRITITYSSPNS
jgi:hypothetical protein